MRKTVDIYDPKTIDTVLEEIRATMVIVKKMDENAHQQHALRRLDRAYDLLRRSY